MKRHYRYHRCYRHCRTCTTVAILYKTPRMLHPIHKVTIHEAYQRYLSYCGTRDTDDNINNSARDTDNITSTKDTLWYTDHKPCTGTLPNCRHSRYNRHCMETSISCKIPTSDSFLGGTICLYTINIKFHLNLSYENLKTPKVHWFQQNQ